MGQERRALVEVSNLQPSWLKSGELKVCIFRTSFSSIPKASLASPALLSIPVRRMLGKLFGQVVVVGM